MGLFLGARGAVAARFFCAAAAAALLTAGCKPKPVAMVNGTELSEKEFLHMCETTTQVGPQRGTVGMQVLVQWIRNALMAQEARKQSVYPSDQELTARVDSIRKNAAFAGVNFEDNLRQQGMTLESFKQDLLQDLINENLVCKGINPTDEECRKRFEDQRSQFTQPEQVRISQITVDSDAKMRQVKNELGPTTQFALVAQTHSKDPFAQSGGVVPFPLGRAGMPAGGPVSKEAVAAAFKLKPGEISDPVKVGANWVFVKLEEKIPEKRPAFEDIKELIRSTLRREKSQSSGQAGQIQQQIVQSFQQAKVEILRPEYQSITQQIQAARGSPGSAAAPMAADGHEGHNHAQPGGGTSTPPPPPGAGTGAPPPPPPPGD